MKYLTGFLVGVFFVISFTSSPKLAKAEENIYVNEKHIHCMATAIYFESKNEPLVGQLAVGLLVKNRAESGMFPKDICDVVYEGPRDSKGMPILNRCQFSWYCDGIPEKISDIAAWEKCLFMSKLILSDKIFDFTDGALFFHNHSVSPKWKLKKIGIIGNHIFYKKHKVKTDV
jgi:spore germination cell wall hydrolase CwlJ-like protein